MSVLTPAAAAILSVVTGIGLFAGRSVAAAPSHAHGADLPLVDTHDNRQSAGKRNGGTLRIALRAGRGRWQPQGDHAPSWEVEAFGEVGGPLQVPAPLIRVRQGTTVVATVRNDLDRPLQVHGLCARDGSPCLPIAVPPGEAREVRFDTGTVGTYYYWATTTGMPLAFRASIDSQLSGALVVDPADGAVDDDRVLVISEWTNLTPEQLQDVAAQADPGAAFLKLKPTVLFTINGRAWPYTERLTYDLGVRVRWRVVNLSSQVHPMHLHGFYFEAERLGDGMRDEAIPADRRPLVVTQLLAPAATMSMSWTPERAGNWLFHCHTMVHVSPTLHVDGSPRSQEGSGHDDHLGAGMTGLVLGITVRGPDDRLEPSAAPTGTTRRLTLLMESEPRRFGEAPALGFRLAEDPVPGPVPIPGPTLVLKRGEPVEIMVVNRLTESTSIHWHGMELESYYDGVHGWSGSGRHLTPLIAPGGTFVVRFTPPRAGTFIYHTHLHDNRQLTSGLYGAMLVVEPDAAFDDTVDHVLVMGRGGPALDAPAVINGQPAPQMVWTAGTRHRIRLINITPNDVLAIALRTNAAPVEWRPLAKDGAEFPAARSPIPAAQVIGVGETYDFEYEAPRGRQTLWLEVRSPGGKWLAQGQVIVK